MSEIVWKTSEDGLLLTVYRFDPASRKIFDRMRLASKTPWTAERVADLMRPKPSIDVAAEIVAAMATDLADTIDREAWEKLADSVLDVVGEVIE